MDVKPTVEQALRRLRLDDELSDDLRDAIDQAHAEALRVLDGKLFPDEEALIVAQDLRGIVVTADIIAAQLLLADALVGNNDQRERDSKRSAAMAILRLHRNMGA
ncbi:hypothetical protein [Paracidovorax citrulli]|uniref:hypothetical protein n=1 Tax=Paracidovorax citrulli TaxID=80869 RepID=UPI0006968CCF|nr:hypothetical protein [Paracidovorax citrulli]